MSTNELDEDRGSLSEQFIEVSALPDVVQTAWRKKRHQIRDLVQSRVESLGASAEMKQIAAEFDDFDRKGVISRIQIQRLLDENDLLVQILGTDKAIDVIRRFTVPEYRNSGEEALEEVMTLQENIFCKLEEFDLSRTGSNLEFGCVDSLKLVATGLHDAMTEIQNQWRNELVFVLEQTNTLASLLTDMTKSLEIVQMNHTQIVHEAGIQQIVGQTNAAMAPGDDK